MTTGRSWAGMRADVNLMRGDGQATAASAPGVEAEDRQGAEQADPTAAPAGDAAAAAAAPAVLAQSLGDYLQAWKTRIRNGESGMLPVLAGLVTIVIFFQLERSQFLSSANLVNLTVQAAVFVLFAAAEVYVLVLSEVDLSVGFVGGVAAFTTAELIGTNVNAPWWLAILAGFAVGAAIGSLQGTLVARLKLPSFVVTLGGLLFWEGVKLELATNDKAAVGGVMSISSSSPVTSWSTAT